MGRTGSVVLASFVSIGSFGRGISRVEVALHGS
jgi:hypothetical protein